ncbi:hypothetical protein M3Y94_00637200 [Aphelenchoides besseyi]|nr:hypothetical protein M3Y94_00637200 [Aphelenchoides besseyi]
MENYYPLDVCRIVSGQRFPHQKMTAEFQGELTRGTQKDPKDLKDTTEAVSKKGHLTHSNLHGKAFKVEIEKKPLSVNAELLHEPAIVWKNSIKDKEPWHQPPTDRKFLINGQCSSFVFANYLRALDQNNVLKFVKRIREQLQQRGTTLPDAQIVNVGDENGIKKLVKDDKPFFLMVVTRNKMDPIHGVLKHMETQSNVITQHVCTKTATAIINNQSNTLENFIMKTNEKLSGTNFNAKASNQFCQTNRKHAEIFQRGWMFLGIDFARGSPTIKEVKNGQPSVIGYVYNYNEQNSLASHCSYQTPAHTIKQDESVDLKFVNYVQNLNITPFIEDYHNRSNAKKWPTHIVIYRSGVPKAEFCNLIRHEKEAIKKSLVDLKKKHRDAPAIGFTIVIVQKDNKRLYPSNNKNPTPGTVIFTDIVSPNYDEFVLVSQRGIIGTAIPVTYTVIADEPTHCKRVNVKELATITFFLAHLHNNVLGTTTLPSVLHHAVQITKRARNNMRYEVYGSIDDNASSTSTGVGRRQMDTDEENCNRLTQNLQFKSNTKFWA